MSRQQRKNRRQANRTQRQESRTEAKQTRQKQRSRRQEARQNSRSQRQQTRQESRTRRSTGRQSVRIARVEAKKDSGFYTPEGIQARRQGTANVIGASGELLSEVAPLVLGAVTGGASLGLGGLGDIAGNLTGIAGESGLQGFGGEVGLGGNPPMQEQNFEVETKSGFDFSFSNPIVLGGLALGGLGLFMLSRPKRKKKV